MQEPSGCYALSTLIQHDKYGIVISFHVHNIQFLMISNMQNACCYPPSCPWFYVIH